ncbi:hypothetical protein AWJ20_5272 [Sugiyamaella lignohabitans]|uniref:PH domain-containing protein n=1 Tax=Sugiyamaella lignohabitans TaxID=796027 RepID=A0A161HLL9_9ASCO|nr:uncharacterized protein AWJ20_5272 [Sugiyamaella lignohabitans]ANB14307.1 hypothetical protein AWJ20_5272 [Sugiyamaella lignohabitans]
MGLWNRLRSGSEVSRQPPYITSSQVFERTLSTPNLADPAQLNALDKRHAEILACFYLEDTPALGLSRTSSIRAATPPDYKQLAPVAPRYPIHPRDEEGKERLPGYQSSIKKSGSLVRKMEGSNPFRPATKRSWTSVHVVLNNTKLDIYNISSRKSTNSGGIGYKIGALIRSYTLQYAEVGLAVDYKKRPFVIRLRAEGEQFLLLSSSEQECVDWAHAIQMGIDLALPLDERKIPLNQSVPRRSRNRRRRSEASEPSDSSRHHQRPRPSSTIETLSTPSSSSSSSSSTSTSTDLAGSDLRLRPYSTTMSGMSSMTSLSSFSAMSGASDTIGGITYNQNSFSGVSGLSNSSGMSNNRNSFSGMSSISPTSSRVSVTSNQPGFLVGGGAAFSGLSSASSSGAISTIDSRLPPPANDSTSRPNFAHRHHGHLPNILSVFSHHGQQNPNSTSETSNTDSSITNINTNNDINSNTSTTDRTTSNTPSASSSLSNLRRITFSLPHHPHKHTKPTTVETSEPEPSSSGDSTLTRSNTSVSLVSTTPAPEDTYDEEDTALNQEHHRRSLSTSEALNAPSSIVYKWNPRRHHRRNHANYAARCLPPLISDAPWLNKTVIYKGKKYKVGHTTLEEVRTHLSVPIY